MALSVQFDSQLDMPESLAISIVLHVFSVRDETFPSAKYCLRNIHDRPEFIKFQVDEHCINHQH